MSNYIIEGGKRVEGKVKISGSKNSSLPIIAATEESSGMKISIFFRFLYPSI